MIAAAGSALDLALACHRSPARLPSVRARQLPPDLLGLLRIAAGDEAELRALAEAAGEPPQRVAEAAVFFIQQVLFAPGADSYRVLGVARDAPDARIREHYRWLVRWQHPDRRGDDWDAVYADRINRAWQDLRLPERRAAYDRATDGAVHAGAGAHGDAEPETWPQRAPARDDVPLVVSGRVVRRLPTVVLGMLGLAATAVLAVMWAARPRVGDDVAGPSPTTPDAETSATLAALEARLAASLAVPEPALAGDAPPMPSTGDVAGTDRPVTQEVRGDAAQVADTTPVGSSSAAAVFAAPPPPLAEPPATTPTPMPATMPSPSPAPVEPPAPPVAVTADVVAVADARPTAAPAPAPTVAEPATVRAAPVADAAVLVDAGPPTPDEAIAVARRFAAAYEAGDLDALLGLFTSDARNNRGSLTAIAEDYEALFAGTDARALDLQVVGWIDRGSHGTLLARYTASVTPAGEHRSEVTGGDIHFDMRRDTGVARISGINHDDP